MENENIIVECQHLQAKKGLKKFSTFRIVFFFNSVLYLAIVPRNGKIVWKHGPFNRSLYIMLKFIERPKTPGITQPFNKNMTLPEGNKAVFR